VKLEVQIGEELEAHTGPSQGSMGRAFRMTTPADLVRQDTPHDAALARRAVVQHSLSTGEYDPKFPAWSGSAWEREVPKNKVPHSCHSCYGDYAAERR
jgi:hypothetical protein